MGEDEITLEVFLKMENPVILSPEWSEGTVYENEVQQDEEEYGYGESEFFQELNDAISGAFYELRDRYGVEPYDLTTEDVMAHLGDNIPEIYYEDIKAYDLYKNLKTMDGMHDNLYHEGNNYVGEFIRLIFEELGHDGAILMNPSEQFPNMGIGSNTKHYMVWNPNSIKLADGSNYTFDPNNPDIRYKEGGKIKEISASEQKMLDDARHYVKTFEKTDEGQLFDRKVINRLKTKRNASKSARNKNSIQNLINKLEKQYNSDHETMRDGGATDTQYQARTIDGQHLFYRRVNNGAWEFITIDEFVKGSNQKNYVQWSGEEAKEGTQISTQKVKKVDPKHPYGKPKEWSFDDVLSKQTGK